MMNAVASRRSVLVRTALQFSHWDGQGVLMCCSRPTGVSFTLLLRRDGRDAPS
jgi:hypothetical protein